MSKRKQHYKTGAYYERLVKQKLKDTQVRQEYDYIKMKYDLASTTTKKMKEQGLTKIDIKKYWKREYMIVSNKYDNYRSLVFTRNYIEVLEKYKVNKDLIKAFKDLSRVPKNRDYLVSRLPAFAFWGYSKREEDNKQIDTDDVILNSLDVLNLVNNMLKDRNKEPLKIDYSNIINREE